MARVNVFLFTVYCLFSLSIMYCTRTQCCGSGAFLTPGSGMGKKSIFGIRDEDHISESLETIFWVRNTLHFLMQIRIREPGWKNSDPGYGINIPDSQHGTNLTYFLSFFSRRSGSSVLAARQAEDQKCAIM